MEASQLKKKLGYGLLLGLVIVIGFIIWGDWKQLVKSFQSFSWTYAPAILGMTLMGYFLRFLKWELFLRTISIRIPLRESLIIFFSGFSMAITPGKAGEVLKSFLLKRSGGIEVSRTAPIIFAERLTDLMGMLVLASWGISRFDYGSVMLWITAVLIVAVVGLIQSRNLCYAGLAWLKRTFPSFSQASKLEIFYESSFALFRFPILISTVLVSVLSWFMECIALFMIFKGLGIDKSLVDATFLFSFSSIAGAISMLPGGLGVAETSMTGIMTFMGIEQGKAIVATLLGRFATLWYGVILGLIVLLAWGRNYFHREDRET